ncbi:MAG: septum formation initiator family protein [Terracidiphilus sp.]
MRDESTQIGQSADGKKELPVGERLNEAVRTVWRPAGTTVAVALILLFGWGVVNGKHGLSAWQQQRVQDQELRQEIQQLQAENERLRDHVERLKTDPGAIEHEAREQLHYAKPGEVIYTLPAQPSEAQPAGSGK